MAERLTFNHCLQLTRHLIDQLYQVSLPAIVPYLSNNIVWINSDMQQYHGYYQVFHYLKSMVGSAACEVNHIQYHLTSSGHAAIVTGQYSVRSHDFYITAVWVLEYCRLKLLHFHVSPAACQNTSAQTIRLYGKNSEIYFIIPGDIMYIEAENIICKVHCASKTFEISQPMNQLEDMVPDTFLRIHRSYIINAGYVRRIKRYEAELSDGTVIPIPEKKYMSVLCQLEQSAHR